MHSVPYEPRCVRRVVSVQLESRSRWFEKIRGTWIYVCLLVLDLAYVFVIVCLPDGLQTIFKTPGEDRLCSCSSWSKNLWSSSWRIFLCPPLTFCPLGLDIPVSALFWNTFNLRCSVNTADQILRPYTKTRGKIIVLHELLINTPTNAQLILI